MKRHFSKRIMVALVAGFFTGAIWLVAVRFATFESDNVHHHANFALYIQGEREEFKSFTFYEEVQSCGSDEVNNPKIRAHMHDKVNHVVHVHDAGVTWGHFFANLGYTLGDKLVQTDDKVYIDGQDDVEINFILNDKPVDTIGNEPINSEDVLVIDVFQQKDGVVASRSLTEDVKRDAGEYNERNDPSSCAGTKELTFKERLRNAIGF